MSSELPRGLEEYVTWLESVERSAFPAGIVEGVSVLGLGEATHGTKEFFELKSEVAVLLADEGFKLFIWEAPFSETLRLNDYVLRGEEDPKEALNNLCYGIWQTEEVLEMVKSFREYNKGRDESQKVKFHGFDVNKSFPKSVKAVLHEGNEEEAEEYEECFEGRFISELEEERLERAEQLLEKAWKTIDDGKRKNGLKREEAILRQEIRATEQGVEMAKASDYGPGSAEYAAEFFQDYLSEVDPEFLEREKEEFSELEEISSGGLGAERIEELIEFVQELKARLDRREEAYRKKGSEEMYKEATGSQIENLENGLRSVEVSETAFQLRERFMAENIENIKDKYNSKTVLWAHNSHVRKSTGSFKSMGRYLKEKFGSRYFSIGFQFARGSFRAFNSATEEMEGFEVEAPEGSLPDNLAENGASLLFLNLREAAKEDNLKKWIKSDHKVFNVGVSLYSKWDTTRKEPLRAYDGLIFVEETRSAIPLK